MIDNLHMTCNYSMEVGYQNLADNLWFQELYGVGHLQSRFLPFIVAAKFS